MLTTPTWCLELGVYLMFGVCFLMPSPNTLVCHMEKPMGSNIAKRVCRTREVLDSDEAQAREMMNRVNQARNASDPAG